MPSKPLAAAQLRRVCDPTQFDFETTAELKPADTIIGQPRGTRAIEFGIGIQSQGYNIYVMAETGMGLTESIEKFLRAHATERVIPDDWLYVQNFQTGHRPRAIGLPSGEGRRFCDRVKETIALLKKYLPEAFESETYREAKDSIREKYKTERDTQLDELRKRAEQDGVTIVDTPSGLVVAPMAEGKAMSLEAYQELPVDERQLVDKKRESWGEELDELEWKLRELDRETREEVRALDKEAASGAISHYFEQLKGEYETHSGVPDYLDAVYKDVLDHLQDFLPERQAEREEPNLRRYEVNLFVDNSELDGAPVVVEFNPSYTSLLGRMEYDTQHGAASAHFLDIFAGSLHRANGGYLVINMQDINNYRDAWEALKRSLKSREIQMRPPDRTDGTQILAKSLDPEPIPLNVTVLLLGNRRLFYRYYDYDDDFGQLFKVRAEFDRTMPRDTEHKMAYASYVAGRCQEEGLRHFDSSAVARLVEFGSRLCEDKNKLSTRFEHIGDTIREASYWAGRDGRAVVCGEDVLQALRERDNRSNLSQVLTFDHFQTGKTLVSTTGTAVGQVNGLGILQSADFHYGTPSRMTATTYRGDLGIVNIEQEIEMSGPFHYKGTLTLIGYLGSRYAQERPLSLSASLTDEQNYVYMDGDSAASTQLYVLLSSLGNLPLKQSIAVTGSVNQKGEIQAIGGVNEKVEGFFLLCRARGLTGDQGVLIPKTNIDDLMLNAEVVSAVETGRFHIWAIETVDEGMELLTGLTAGEADAEGHYPAGSIHFAVQEGLKRLAKSDDDDDDDGDENSTSGGDKEK